MNPLFLFLSLILPFFEICFHLHYSRLQLPLWLQAVDTSYCVSLLTLSAQTLLNSLFFLLCFPLCIQFSPGTINAEVPQLVVFSYCFCAYNLQLRSSLFPIITHHIEPPTSYLCIDFPQASPPEPVYRLSSLA